MIGIAEGVPYLADVAQSVPDVKYIDIEEMIQNNLPLAYAWTCSKLYTCVEETRQHGEQFREIVFSHQAMQIIMMEI